MGQKLDERTAVWYPQAASWKAKNLATGIRLEHGMDGIGSVVNTGKKNKETLVRNSTKILGQARTDRTKIHKVLMETYREMAPV